MRTCLIVALPLLASSILGACGAEPPEARPPNIVMIIGDDAGYTDFGFMGSPYAETPNLDRLAEEGFLFTHGFSSASMCRPALRSLLTGFDPYQWNHHMRQLSAAEMMRGIRNFTTLPTLLAERGYTSFEAGKFWEGSDAAAGFSAGMHGPDAPDLGGTPEKTIGRVTMQPVFDFLDANADGPFFLWFAPMLPHLPHDAPDRFRALYDHPELTRFARAYYANVSWLDDVVGQLLAFLDDAGLREETLIVYLTDNGWDQEPRGSRLIPLRDGPRGKQTLHELGLRTPIIFHWPGRIPAGERNASLVSILDIFPTLLDYADVATPAGRPGRSLRPLLEGEAMPTRERIVNWMARSRTSSERPRTGVDPWLNADPAFALRNDEWRYVWHPDDDHERLYHVASDPGERREVSWKHPELLTRFREEIAAWRDEMERPFADPGDVAPAAGR